MNGFPVILIILCLGLIGNDHSPLQPIADDYHYRVAKYSAIVEFSDAVEIMPELANMLHSSITSYKYYIQYGKNTLIEIIDPGNEIEYLGVIIIKWDYSKSKSSYTLILDHVRKYHTSIDTISFSITECRGSVKNLCDGVTLNARCDSVSFVSHYTNKQYTLHFNDTIHNLPSHGLFYPDIEYLPNKIIRVGRSKNNIQTLEEVIYGKPAVDSILNLFNYEGYEEIPDEEWKHRDPQVEELIEKFKKFEGKKK